MLIGGLLCFTVPTELKTFHQDHRYMVPPSEESDELWERLSGREYGPWTEMGHNS